ncbi:MAG TPA: DUF488 domain-containing protein [Verrucomicrobiae bacterium]|jgi:uncharacterized protein (DUF488 family)|nr:DUF488 domain-containing protein [Verrucomicrobiae bacterium]
MPEEIWTVGHSRRTFEEFIALLKSAGIQTVADVRRFAVSKRFPHFSQMQLFKSLAVLGIEYEDFGELGGRRRPLPDSPNTLWRNESFRGYADFMMTPKFQESMERLIKVAATRRTAIMCAEALWWRCHRALISDYLKAGGVKVTHIIEAGKTQEHPYTSAAHVLDGKLSYAPAQTAL